MATVTTAIDQEDIRTTDVVICGGGPTGLLAAIMLAQKFPKYTIQVYDRQTIPPLPTDQGVWGDTSRHYLIGLGGRGISSLEQFGVWDEVVAPFCLPVPGRKDWTPETPEGVESFRTDRTYVTQVLPRDKLVSLLYHHIVNTYPNQIELYSERVVRPLDFDYCGEDSKVLVEVMPERDDNDTIMGRSERISASLVVASDGSARTFANCMEDESKANISGNNDFHVVRYDDDNVRVFKTIPFRIPTDWIRDVCLNYSVRSAESRVIFDALPATDQGDYVGLLLLRGDDDMAQPGVDPTVFRAFLNKQIPQFTTMLEDDAVAAAAQAEASLLPRFRYVTPRMYQGKRTILLGDTAHTVKPFFGMGANSALEDVKLFWESLNQTTNLTEAIRTFSDLRTPDIEALVRTSRNLDKPGVAGVFYFLIPVIMDGIFQKLAPQIFRQNIISLIQNEKLTFQEAVRRKRLDRIGQLLLIGGGMWSIVALLHGVADAVQSATASI